MPLSVRPLVPSFVPLRLDRSGIGAKAVLVLLGSLFLAASAQITVPMVPVPMTMQTYAVLVIGALCGWRLGAITVLAYLGQAAIGLPFLAGGAGGPLPFVGPTAGYLVGFVLGAALIGWLAERGWTSAGFVRSNAALLLAHAVVFIPGIAWLALPLGLGQAIAVGFAPFILGSILKSALVYVTVEAWRRNA